MKKFISILLSIVFIFSLFSCIGTFSNAQTVKLTKGSIIKFGKYEQDEDKLGKEDIEWEVMEDCGDGNIIVMSKKLLDCKRYDDATYSFYTENNVKKLTVKKNNVVYKAEYDKKKEDYIWTGDCPNTWENCTLRSWLNKDFFNSAFTANEKKAIVQQVNMNNENPYYKIKNGGITLDNVWIPSLDEFVKYYNYNKFPTLGKDESWFKPQKTVIKELTNYAFWKKTYPTKEAPMTSGRAACWWLRNKGINSTSATKIIQNSNVDCLGDFLNVNYNGVCPVIKLSKDYFNTSSSSASSAVSSTISVASAVSSDVSVATSSAVSSVETKETAETGEITSSTSSAESGQAVSTVSSTASENAVSSKSDNKGTVKADGKLKAPKKTKFSLKSKKKGKKKVRISLKKIKGAEKLAFRYKLKKSKKWKKPVVKPNVKKTYTVKGLKSGKKYSFSIRYKKGKKWSKWSKVRNIKVK